MKKSTIIVTVIIFILASVAIGFGAYLLLQNNNFKYPKEIKIDASLATQPLANALVEELTEFNITKDFTNTDPAYTKLINKEVDLIIVTEPSEDELERAKKNNVELEVTPIVNEGFVFFVNAKNKVDNLDLSEIQKIYTGEITNWKEIGGSDDDIVAYQRPENSGSQTGMLSLVMKGLKMKEPLKTESVETMAGIIEYVSSYENGLNSIGYSYYYYATTMYTNDNMKLLGINGVKPTYETIQDGSYPIKSAYYIVTLKDNNDKTLNKFKETLLNKKGQNIAKKAGYVAIK